MAFPPEFSSTLTYANKYDLDEIDVFLEGDSTNPMYFSIDGLSKTFTFGKHYFTISILDSINQPYQLRGGSRVLFEFKSVNNVVLKSDIVKINERNGVITGFFEILRDPLRTYKEIQDGQGTFIIAASLQGKPAYERGGQTIPPQFKDAINYRCVYPINIAKNKIGGNAPIITNVDHIQKTIAGAFSFIDNSLPTLGEEGAEYSPQGNRTTKGPSGQTGLTD